MGPEIPLLCSLALPLSHDLKSSFSPLSPFLFLYHVSLYSAGGCSELEAAVEYG